MNNKLQIKPITSLVNQNQRFSVTKFNSKILRHHFSWLTTPYNKSDSVSYVRKMRNNHRRKNAYYFSLLENRKYVGEVAVDSIYGDEEYGNLCYWVCRSQQGKGVATKAILLLKRWLQANTRLKYLEIGVEQKNKASRGVIRKLKATYIKTTTDYRLVNGRMAPKVMQYNLKLR